MMELGATICLPRQPLCLECPVMNLCRTRGEHATAARDKPQSRVVAHLLTLRKRGTATEVLLLRRPPDAALMPKMLELPPLPLEAVEGREPVLRLRHAITNTNYYVQIFAESAPGVAPLALHIAGEDETETPCSIPPRTPAHPHLRSPAITPSSRQAPARPPVRQRHARIYEDDDLFTPETTPTSPASTPTPASPLPRAPCSPRSPPANPTSSGPPPPASAFLPLTGLTRKVLQRLGVMTLPRVQLS